MSAPEAKTYTITPQTQGAWISALVNVLPVGWRVTVKPPGRSLDQNSALHGYCSQIAKARPEWNGLAMSAEDWKALLVVSHAVATADGSMRLVMDLEGSGLVQLRESTAKMNKARASSLIEYTIAWATGQGIPLSDQQP